MRLVGNPHRRQLAGAQQTGQSLRIPAVGLHPLARPARDQRGRNHHARVPQRQDLPIQAIAGRTRLVADVQGLVTVGQLADELCHCVRRVVELAQVADLASPPALCHRHRVPSFGSIDPDKCFPMSLHGSSPMR